MEILNLFLSEIVPVCRWDKGFVVDTNGECVCPPGSGIDVNGNCVLCREVDGFRVDANGRCVCAIERGFSIDERGKCVCAVEHGYTLTPLGECVQIIGCVNNDECADHEVCTSERRSCVSACAGFTCGEHAFCYSTNHTAICKCVDGYTGNPYVECGKLIILMFQSVNWNWFHKV